METVRYEKSKVRDRTSFQLILFPNRAESGIKVLSFSDLVIETTCALQNLQAWGQQSPYPLDSRLAERPSQTVCTQ